MGINFLKASANIVGICTISAGIYSLWEKRSTGSFGTPKKLEAIDSTNRPISKYRLNHQYMSGSLIILGTTCLFFANIELIEKCTMNLSCVLFSRRTYENDNLIGR